ncbi:MAG: PAS domain-containing protein [Leptospirillia bacterium]
MFERFPKLRGEGRVASFLIVLAAVFVADGAGLLALDWLSDKHDALSTHLLHTLGITLLAAPVIWWWGVRPTERKAEHKTLRARELVASAADGIITLDKHLVIRSFSPGAVTLFGYPEHEATGRNLTLLLARPGRRDQQHTLAERLSTCPDEVICLSLDGRRRDGTVFPAEVTVKPIPPQSGTCLYVAVIRDISARRAEEQKRRESEARYQTLADTVPVGVFRTDPDGGCIYVNDRWCEISGLTAEQAEGDGWTSSIHPDDRKRVWEEWEESLAEERPFSLEYRFFAPGRERDVGIWPIHARSGYGWKPRWLCRQPHRHHRPAPRHPGAGRPGGSHPGEPGRIPGGMRAPDGQRLRLPLRRHRPGRRPRRAPHPAQGVLDR